MASGAAAVDIVDFAGHVVRVFEIVDCTHDILNLAVAVQRRERPQLLGVLPIVKRRHDDADEADDFSEDNWEEEDFEDDEWDDDADLDEEGGAGWDD